MRHYFPAALLVVFFLSSCTDNAPEPQPHWRISASYIHDTVLLSDARIADALKSGEWKRLKARNLPKGVYARYRGMSAKMHIKRLPALYLDEQNDAMLPQAAARFSQNRRGYILLNRRALDIFNARELIAILGHELVHLARRHVSAENLARAYNDASLSVAHEFEADRLGSGVKGSCDPKALGEALRIIHEADSADYLGHHPAKSPEDYEGLPSNDHPHYAERQARLSEMAKQLPAQCKRH